MNKIIKATILFGLIVGCVLAVSISRAAFDTSGNFQPPEIPIMMYDGSGVVPANTSWTLGHSGQRIDMYADNLNANVLTINTSVTSTLDMNNNIITNIGNASTDFDTSGGLALAGTLDASGTSTLATTTVSGRLGVGTTTPDKMLTIQAPSGDNADIRLISDAGEDSQDDWRITANGSGLKFQDAYGRYPLFLEYNNGVIMNLDTDAGDDFQIDDTSSNRLFTVEGDTGKVGIGTTTPDTALHTIGTTTISGNLALGGKAIYGADKDTIADNGTSTAATATLNPSTSYVELTCNDSDTCDITMDETNAKEGQRVLIVNVSANTCDFSETSGVSEINGNYAMAQYETLELAYIGDRWVETSRSVSSFQ